MNLMAKAGLHSIASRPAVRVTDASKRSTAPAEARTEASQDLNLQSMRVAFHGRSKKRPVLLAQLPATGLSGRRPHASRETYSESQEGGQVGAQLFQAPS